MATATVVGRLVRAAQTQTGSRGEFTSLGIRARSGMTAQETKAALAWLRDRDLVLAVRKRIGIKYQLAAKAQQAWQESLEHVQRYIDEEKIPHAREQLELFSGENDDPRKTSDHRSAFHREKRTRSR